MEAFRQYTLTVHDNSVLSLLHDRYSEKGKDTRTTPGNSKAAEEGILRTTIARLLAARPAKLQEKADHES